jgi:tRNA (guanine26-N2/guanine27-N2)-dimethyltransferase
MLKEAIEGQTRLLVTGKGTLGRTEKGREKKAPVFYNPRMKLNRDICCAFARTLEDGKAFADVLAGSGAKGIRVANESSCTVHLNDGSRHAFELIKKNAGLNDVNVEVSNLDANLFLAKNKFDFIDIDPFGTPVPFLDNAVLASSKDGYLGVTATDTAPLCGVYPAACFRKYGAKPLRSEFCHETGLRILLGHVARTAAKYKRGVKCLLSHSTEHYFRLYVKLATGKRKADASLSEMGYVYYCRKCLAREYKKGFLPEQGSCECGNKYEAAGPLWLGRIKEGAALKKVIKNSYYLNCTNTERLLNTVLLEIDVPFYYDVHRLCKTLKMNAPPIDEVMDALLDEGYAASRTHFAPTGIRTDAPLHKNLNVLFG